MSAVSIGARLASADNRPSGFDYLRLSLSTAVIAFHTIMICYGRSAETPWWTGIWRPLPFFILPSFFALSGFLVAGSLNRNDLPSFLTLRGLRIFPALGVEVLISALIIGPLLTTVSLHEYFFDVEFRKYFLNILGDIHYHLPGVFADNPGGSAVNLQLWTVPMELQCYIFISLIALVGLHRRPKFMIAGLIVAAIGIQLVRDSFEGIDQIDLHPNGLLLVMSFLFGVALFELKERIPHNRWLFAIACLAMIALNYSIKTMYLTPLPIAYMTVFMGLLNPRRNFVIRGADYSYGMYLYGYPVQQAVAYTLPGLRIWYVLLPISLAVTAAFAATSWHLIELNVLKHRKRALRAAHRVTVRIPVVRRLITEWAPV